MTEAPARTRRPLAPIVAVLAAALVLAALASIAIGNRDIPVATVIDALTGYNANDTEHIIVVTQRLPRTLLGLEAGIALGLAGALMQALTRNLLADPGLLGVNAGASLAVVTSVSLFGFTSFTAYVWPAMLGAALAAVCVYALSAGQRGGATPTRLVLAGAAISALIQGGVVRAILLIDPAAFDAFRAWDVGSLAARDIDTALQVLPFIAAGAFGAVALARPLNAMALGDEAARSVGSRPGRTRLIGGAAVTVLSGAATAAVGPIGFVGLAVPFVIRSLVGPDQRRVLPCTLLAAPTLLLAADVLGRIAMRTSELPVGLVTAFIGAPVLIALARRRKLTAL